MSLRWPALRARYGALSGAVVALFLACAGTAEAGRSVELVFGEPEAATARRISAVGSEDIPVPASTPLGSVWKLFVYTYLNATNAQEPEYRCTGRDVAEEAYCCAPGERIGRDAALAKSCGLYFAPQRLGISPGEWHDFWQHAAPQAPDWLGELNKLQPATEVTVVSLLAALRAIGDEPRQAAWRALQRVTLEPRARPFLSHLGNAVHVKTWSWHTPAKEKRIGGFAGWLADGTPVWLRGEGTSLQVMAKAAPWLAGQLPRRGAPETACVTVRFFTRYPLAEVQLDGRPADAGPLRGKVEARFVNGQRLSFPVDGDIVLNREGKHPRLTGRFGLNDYVARVVQREAAGDPPAAARALAVAARTYLVRNAGFGGGCYEIDDDSRAQRVSPAPPARAALAAAEWSDGLILAGADGQYHSHKAVPNRLVWQTAVTQARDGRRWDEILDLAYGNTGFTAIGEDDAAECQPLAAAEAWLAGRQPVWKKRLAGLPGFEVPSPLPRICRLDHGNPYADIERGRIYATGVGSANERLTVAHEYLHFALAFHPQGRDEDFVERTARRLLDMP